MLREINRGRDLSAGNIADRRASPCSTASIEVNLRESPGRRHSCVRHMRSVRWCYRWVASCGAGCQSGTRVGWSREAPRREVEWSAELKNYEPKPECWDKRAFLVHNDWHDLRIRAGVDGRPERWRTDAATDQGRMQEGVPRGGGRGQRPTVRSFAACAASLRRATLPDTARPANEDILLHTSSAHGHIDVDQASQAAQVEFWSLPGGSPIDTATAQSLTAEDFRFSGSFIVQAIPAISRASSITSILSLKAVHPSVDVCTPTMR